MSNKRVVIPQPVDAYQFLFVTLKLCGQIDWSWWCVFIPMYLRVLRVFADLLEIAHKRWGDDDRA